MTRDIEEKDTVKFPKENGLQNASPEPTKAQNIRTRQREFTLKVYSCELPSMSQQFLSLYYFFIFIFYFLLFIFYFVFHFFYFTTLYWFCHTLTWIRHGCNLKLYGPRCSIWLPVFLHTEAFIEIQGLGLLLIHSYGLVFSQNHTDLLFSSKLLQN